MEKSILCKTACTMSSKPLSKPSSKPSSKTIKTYRRVLFNSMAAFLFIVVLAAPGIQLQAAGPTPIDVIRTSNQQVQDIFNANKTIDDKIEAKLYKIIDGVTDYKTISGQVITRFCKKLKPQQCKTFDNVFIELLRVSSIKKLGRYRADKFEYLGQEIKENKAVVKTIAYYKEDKAELDYHLELKDGNWKIVNYVLDDIDTVRNYKKQFKRLFQKKSFDEVIQRLRKKIANYQKESREN